MNAPVDLYFALQWIDNGAFTYNAYGSRVYNTSGPVSFLYDPSGQLIGGNWANGAGWNAGIRFGSRLMAMYAGDGGHTAYFTHANALGSSSQTTDYAGNGAQAIISRRPAIGVCATRCGASKPYPPC